MKNIVIVSALLICIFTGLVAAQFDPPKTVYASKDGQAKLECIIQGSASKCEFSSIGTDGTSNVMLTSYSPEKANIPFDQTGVLMTMEDNLSQGRCTLILDNVQPEISGIYTCKIYGMDKKKYTQNFNLIVLVMPTLTEIFYNGNAIPNGTRYELQDNGYEEPITLEVRAERGIPAARGHWEVEDVFDPPYSNETVIDEPDNKKTTVGKLTIQISRAEPKPERSLTYTSYHESYPDKSIFRTISIGYSYKTKHAEIKKALFKSPGKDDITQLTCIADGIPKPNVINWQWANVRDGPFEPFTEQLNEHQPINDQINTTIKGFYICCAQNIKNTVCVPSLPAEVNGKTPPPVMPRLSEIFFNGIPIENGSDFEIPNDYSKNFITLVVRAENGYPAAQAEWVIVGHLGEYDVDTTIVDVDMGLKTTISNVIFEIPKEETRPERTVIFISQHPLYPNGQNFRIISIGYPRSTSGSDDCVTNGSPKPEFYSIEFFKLHLFLFKPIMFFNMLTILRNVVSLL